MSVADLQNNCKSLYDLYVHLVDGKPADFITVYNVKPASQLHTNLRTKRANSRKENIHLLPIP